MAAAEFIPFVPKSWNFRNRVGERYGRLVALAPFSRAAKPHEVYWQCACDCGNTSMVASTTLGATKSCGCLCSDINRAMHLTHNKRHTPTYNIWRNMVQRCTNPATPQWNDYGGRGISVCDAWRTFIGFLADMGEAPPHLELDREDNNGNYEKSNCRWATRKEQANNKRSNRIVEFNGESMTLKQLSERCGIPYKLLHCRLNKHGWSLDRAATEPPYTSKYGHPPRTA